MRIKCDNTTHNHAKVETKKIPTQLKHKGINKK